MQRLEKSSVIKSPPQRLYDFFLDPNNLLRISPPDIELSEMQTPVPITAGSTFTFKARNGMFRFTWQGRVLQLESPKLMVDEQDRGPFKHFRHLHRLRDMDTHTLYIDEIEYEPRFGFFGKLLDTFVIHPRLKRLFEYRHARLKELMESEPPPQRSSS